MSHAGRVSRQSDAARGVGFTLVELLVAIALMAVLAVLGWRGLDSVLDSRARISQASDSLRAMSVAFAQMQEDLHRAWPVRLLNLTVPPVGFVAQSQEQATAMLLMRESLPAGGAPKIQRVVYRLHKDVLERGFARWAVPDYLGGVDVLAAADAREKDAPEDQSFVWQPLVSGVRSLQFRAWVPGRGWLLPAALAQTEQAGS
ncbi:MAG: prepilin-type N-terminal cleavage/methylation domain-containing protein, partial [Quisquiliibacterium sp.]